MIPELRKKFNKEFKQSNYDNFLNELNSILKYPADFRVCETPAFLPDELTFKLDEACSEIIDQLQNPEFRMKSQNAVPERLRVPNESDHPEFLQIDFGICENEDGSLIPRLIELQGFPTIYGYQYFYTRLIKKHFNIDEKLTPYFNVVDEEKYKKSLKKIIVGNSDPENVILLEIEPHKQKTRIDFAATEDLIGIKEVCISDVIQQGKKLFYKNRGKTIPVERIYNRVIFDELESNGTGFSFDFRDELDVNWIAHPNWFFKISKYSLPLLSGQYVPDCHYLSNFTHIPENPGDYVLKPLFSFAGHGVDVEPTLEKIKLIDDPGNYILQQKINYAPVIKTPVENSKIEIRMMFFWDDKPVLVNNLVRLSKGKMMGVDFNKNKTWVGSSQAFHY